MTIIVAWFTTLILIGLVLVVLGIKRIVTDMRSTAHLDPPTRMLRHVITEYTP